MSNRRLPPLLLRRNDWGPLTPPVLETWSPSLRVTVVVTGPADQGRLDPTLAALCHQTYPADLLDVVVVDHGPTPTLGLPSRRPGRCRIVGPRRGAVDPAVADDHADVVLRMTTGTIPAPEFVAALARWHHLTPLAVSIAAPPLLAPGSTTADEIADHCAAGTLNQLGVRDPGVRHGERGSLLDATDQLRDADHLAFEAVGGASFAYHRDSYEAGADPYEGTDIEIGYRLAQAGAIFIPEPQARTWVLPMIEAADDAASRLRRVVLADLMPYPRANRRAGGRSWSVPLVTAVVPAEGPYEMVRTCVDRLLGSDEPDLRVLLVGDWAAPVGGDREELALLAAEYRSEPRVDLVGSVPANVFPSPYLLKVPARLGVGASTVRALVAAAERWRAGLIRTLPTGAKSPALAVELWSTAARNRARRSGVPDADLVSAVAAMYGERWQAGSEYDVTDLSALPAARWMSPEARRADPASIRPPSGETVAVGGARSLARATRFVAHRYARAARRRLVSR